MGKRDVDVKRRYEVKYKYVKEKNVLVFKLLFNHGAGME